MKEQIKKNIVQHNERKKQKGKEIVQHNIFYKRGAGRSRKGYLESPETRRAAGISIRED